MENWAKYIAAAAIAGVLMGAAYYYPAETFIAFVADWLYLNRLIQDKDKYKESYCADVDTIGMGRYNTVKYGS